MIIQNYIIREIGHAFLAVFLVLFAVLMSTVLIKVMTAVAEGTYPADLLFTLFGLHLIAPLTIVIPLAYFLAVMLARGRLLGDYELYAMYSCGLSQKQLMHAVFVSGAMLAVVVLLLSLLIAPWSQQQRELHIAAAAANSTIGGVSAGKFQTIGVSTLFIGDAAEQQQQKQLQGIFFVRNAADGALEVVTADGVVIDHQSHPGETLLSFERGKRYVVNFGSLISEQMVFGKYHAMMEQPATIGGKSRLDAASSSELLLSVLPQYRLELYGRIAEAVMVIILGLIAINLGRMDPRQGRFGAFFGGITLYLIYFYTEGALVTAIENQRLPLQSYWILHLIFAVFALWQSFRLGRQRRSRRHKL